MRKFSLSLATVVLSFSLLLLGSLMQINDHPTPVYFPYHDAVKKSQGPLSSVHQVKRVILKNARMTSHNMLQIDTHTMGGHREIALKKQSRFFVSTSENPAYVMAKNVNVLARSSTGAMSPYSGKIDNVRENILCPDVGVGVGYKISPHVTVSAAYDGAFLTMADGKHYNKNLNAAGLGLTVRF